MRAQPLSVVLALLCLGLLGYAVNRVADRGRFATPYSTYSAGPDGAQALGRLARALGFRTRRITRELTELAPGTLVVLGPCGQKLPRPLYRPEQEAIAAWVERGGLLIVAGPDQFVPLGAGMSIDPLDPCASARDGAFGALWEVTASTGVPPELPVLAEPSGPPLTYAAPFLVETAARLRVAVDSHATEMLSSELGPLGLTAPLGRGRVVLLGIADALTNRFVARGAGVAFARILEAFAPAGPVQFDEYHLGMGERRSLVRYLRDTGYAPAALQACLALLALLLAGAGRIARPQTPLGPRSRASHFATTLGALYARTGDEEGAVFVLSEHALQRIAKHYQAHGVPPRALGPWLRERGLSAVAMYATRIEARGRTPLSAQESLLGRVREIERDEIAAIALGDAP